MDLELTRIFVKVAQNGSFSKAAQILKLPKSTVSKAISKLEKETGTILLMRTTRSLTLTASGRAFYETSLGPIRQLEDAQKSLYGKDSIMSGLVRITAPEDLGSFVLSPAISKLAAQHPQLNFEIVCTDDIVDLVKDGFDIAVRIGRVNESRFKVKKAGEFPLILVASPQYLKDKEKIKKPQDLHNHYCLSLNIASIFNKWTLKSSKGTVPLSIQTKLSTNQMTSLIQMALSGGGVALVPQYLCQKELDSGKLVHVLPEWSSPSLPVWIVSPLGSASSARLKMAIDCITEALSSNFRK